VKKAKEIFTYINTNGPIVLSSNPTQKRSNFICFGLISPSKHLSSEAFRHSLGSESWQKLIHFGWEAIKRGMASKCKRNMLYER